MQENFKPEFKLIIENLQEKLHQGKRKQSKGAKICASNRYKLDCEKCRKIFAKYLEHKIKIIQKISVTLRTFLTIKCIKWVPKDPSTTFLATIFARGLRLHVFLHFNARNHMILSFYLKWTKFKTNC